MANFIEDPNAIDPMPKEADLPAWLVAADNHNIGNTRGGSWLDASTWSDKLGSGGSLIATGMLSGLNSFYNTAITIGNWFGADAEAQDTKQFISGIDSDLGQYYDKNRTAADLVGFVAGSLIPGLGGIKVLRAGQEALAAGEILNAGQVALQAGTKGGFIGENLSRATGLLVPQTEKYIASAAADISSAQATFNAINANGIKALASGVYQNVLEGMAFETMVQATMFKSPILEDQDGWDITKNIVTGGLFQGALGGALEGASTLFKIRKLVAAEDLANKPFSSRLVPDSGLSPANKIILMAEDRDLGAVPLKDAPIVTQTAYKDKLTRVANDIRTESHAMVPGSDSELGNMIADVLVGADHVTTLNNLFGTETATRLGGVSKVEREINDLAKNGQTNPELQVAYVKLTGEGAGTVTDTEPGVANLSDTVARKAGQSTEDAVLDAVRDKGFKLKNLWSAVDATGTTGHITAEARYIWADKILKDIPDDTLVHQYDLPVLERALKDGQTNIKLVDKAGKVVQDGFSSKQALQDYLINAKQDVGGRLVQNFIYKQGIPQEQGMPAIGKIINTKIARLDGTSVGNDADDFFAWQKANRDYAASTKQSGLQPANAAADTRFLPTFAKLSKRVPGLMDADGNVIDGMTFIKQQQKMLQLAVENVASKASGGLLDNMPGFTDAQLLATNRYGAGARFTGYANGSYGSPEATVQLMGTITNKLKKSFRDDTADALTGSAQKMASKLDAAIEWATVNQKVTRSAEQWVRHTEGDEEYLITKKAAQTMQNEKEPLDFSDLDDSQKIQLHNEEVAQMADAHISRNGWRVQTEKELRAAQGHTNAKDPDVFQPIRQNYNDFNHFAFVKDDSVTGTGHTTMIHAFSDEHLQQLINKVPPQYRVITKGETADYFQARSEYDYQRTLHESQIDQSLKRAGIDSDFFTPTDPQKIVNDLLQHHLRADDTLATELVRAKNENAFNYLEDQAKSYSKIESSKYGSYNDRLSASVKNPFLDYIKTALDISKMNEHPLWASFNRQLDDAVSKAVSHVSDLFKAARSPADLNVINTALDKYGMNTGYRGAALDALVNHTAPKGVLSDFINRANTILSKTILSLDPLNVLHTSIGSGILRGTELKQLTDAIQNGNQEIAGQLGKLLTVKYPGLSDGIVTPGRIMGQALKNFASDDGTLLAQYKSIGAVLNKSETSLDQFRNVINTLTLRGDEGASQLSQKINQAFHLTKELSEAGEKYTGNAFAEQFNRFISADCIRQLTDIGVNAGVMSEKEANVYINTFVNRTSGIKIASQRPIMFQGPVGQAIGLFQSYQFNIMQQLFRYVAEGDKKDAAMLMGLQGTFFGMQDLPAFQFINQHIVGTASGNQKHVDLYDATYGVLGQQLGDLALYGLPSNLLHANIYARGDINPRRLTVIPTSLPDIPFVSAFGRLFGAIKDSVVKMQNGGNVWESMLQGLEHQGLSRPLAGLAQTLQAAGPDGQVFSTTTKGSILSSNDLMSWATAVRLAGGKPLDEAIVSDGVQRIHAYQQGDLAKMQQLSEAVKSSTIQGITPVPDQIATFAAKYAADGGRQGMFTKYMMNEFKAANTSESEKIAAQLQNPFAQKVQILMGGGSDVTPLQNGIPGQ